VTPLSGREPSIARPPRASLVSRRILSLLLSLWFTVITVSPERVHTCPTHSAPVAADASDSDDHGGHGGHGGHAEHATTPDERAPDDHGCRCIGSCTIATGAAAPSVPGLLVSIAAAADPGLPDHEYAVVERSHRLPFANGPPRA
jgi:hypothetical protein